MRILLANSYLISRDPPERRIMRPYPPLGIMYLARALSDIGLKPIVIDLTFESSLKQYFNSLKNDKLELVGISAVETTRKTALEMVAMASLSGKKVIVGGPDPVNARDAYFKAGASWICDGEGERTLVELTQNLQNQPYSDISKIKGLYYLDGKDEIFTGKRDLIENIDDIQFPDFQIVPINDYISAWKEKHGENALSVISSRGCPRSCSWCSRAVFGRSFRRRSAFNFVSEIKLLSESYKPDYFWFADDSFTSSDIWLDEFQKELDKSNLRITYECLGRVDEISDRTARILKSSGCRFIWFGAESGSQRILDSMNKGISVDDIHRASAIIREHNIPFGFFIMLGYPPENLDDIYKTVEIVRSLKPNKVGVSVAYPISGTQFYDEIINKKKRSAKWTKSGENRLIYRTRYCQAFYNIARRLILKESQLASKQKTRSRLDNIKLTMYKSAVEILSNFSVN